MSTSKAVSLLQLIEHAYQHTSFSVNEIEYCYHEGTIAIRGTEVHSNDSTRETLQNAWDIVRDVRIMPWKTSGLPWGAAGFVRGGVRVFNQLQENGITPKELTGHSLGGAIAIVVSELFAQQGTIIPVTTFGAPKVFYSKVLKDHPEQAVRMYRNGGDPVPKVFLGKHPRDLIQLTEGGFSFKDHLLTSYKSTLNDNNSTQ